MRFPGIWVATAMLGFALAAAPGLAQGRGPGGGGPPGGAGQAPGGQGLPGGQGPGGQGLGGQGPGAMGVPGGVGPMNAGGRGAIPPAAGGGDRVGASGPNGINGSMQMGPVGRWWDDKGYANQLSLRPEQKRRMDAIFNGNRGELTEKVTALRDAEAKLEATTQSGKVGAGSVFGQIDRVATARDALEKVNLRLMESLRKELDADQVARLQGLK